MKKILLALVLVLGFTMSSNAQLHTKKDGSPDMRFKENKQVYGSSYSSPSSYPSQSSNSSRSETYTTPSSYPSSRSTQSSYPSYPTNKMVPLTCVTKKIRNCMVSPTR